MTKNVVPQGLARIAEATEYLRISKSKLYLMMGLGELTYVQFGRSRRIPWAELLRLVERHTIPASKGGSPLSTPN